MLKRNLTLGGRTILATRDIVFAILISFIVSSCLTGRYYWIDDTRATAHGKKAHAKSMKAARKGNRKINKGF